jgi:hypothetical protein
VGTSLRKETTVIVTVVLTYTGGGRHKSPHVLDIDAWHAYRDAKGRLHTPSHHVQVPAPMPQNVTDGLRHGIAVLNQRLQARVNPFTIPETADLEEWAFRMVG